MWKQKVLAAVGLAVALALAVYLGLKGWAAMASRVAGAFAVGGAAARRPGSSGRRGGPGDHVVVDTLNLTHWNFSTARKRARMSAEQIGQTITAAAGILKAKFKGRVMFVIKDREATPNSEKDHERLQALAKQAGVYIMLVEKYAGEGKQKQTAHAVKGRDDFYMALLAHKWKAPVLSEDRFRDFGEFRQKVPPFRVFEFSYWQDRPTLDFVRPEAFAYRRLRPPAALRYAEVLGAPLSSQEKPPGSQEKPSNFQEKPPSPQEGSPRS